MGNKGYVIVRARPLSQKNYLSEYKRVDNFIYPGPIFKKNIFRKMKDGEELD